MLPKNITNSLTDILTASLKNPGDGPLVLSNDNNLVKADEDDGDWERQDCNDEKLITQKVEELAGDDLDVLEAMDQPKIPDGYARSVIEGQVKARTPLVPSCPRRGAETSDGGEDFTVEIANVSESESEGDQVKLHTAAPARPRLRQCISRVVEINDSESESEEAQVKLYSTAPTRPRLKHYTPLVVESDDAQSESEEPLDPHVASPPGQHPATPLPSKPSSEFKKPGENDSLMTVYGIDISKVAGRVPPKEFPAGL